MSIFVVILIVRAIRVSEKLDEKISLIVDLLHKIKV